MTFTQRAGREPAATLRNSEAPYRIVRFGHRGPVSLVWGAARAGRSLLAREDVDLIHVHFAYPAIGIYLPPRPKVPVVRTYYGSWAAEADVEAGARRLAEGRRPRATVTMLRDAAYRARWTAEALSLGRSRRVIVLSEFSRDEVTREFGVPPERVDVVPGGVDLDRFRPGDRAAARQRLGLPRDRRVLLTVRRLVPRMGLDALLSAWSLVLSPSPEPPLLLIGGKGPLGETLRSQAAALGIEEHVRFLGFVPDEELPLYYQAADAFVLPTRALEGFGLPTLEAFASGRPVLGTPVAATPELLRQVEPRLILPGVGAAEMAEGLRAFLETPLPPTCAPERLRAFVESRYDWERVVEETMAVYDSALRG